MIPPNVHTMTSPHWDVFYSMTGTRIYFMPTWFGIGRVAAHVAISTAERWCGGTAAVHVFQGRRK
jgi:hypothetical protein